eukprot:TRINITY_DN45954_c0_g1_i1.p1 TRINITY_DN45954_c0_g1~~TRINITY_DN45954_c0_g1_i1.p1  ORF type:complete len:366 (+),score=68.86 TRINITY_DN45954_c0_g1_i1:91-1188(+)
MSGRLFCRSIPLFRVIEVNGVKETIIERTDYPLSRCHEILKDQRHGVIGYGPQGRGQALNLRDQGFSVHVGVRKGASWDAALKDGWKEGKDLFEIKEAAERATYVQYLLSDAAQIALWPTVKGELAPGKTLYFSHGFGIVYHDQTDIIPPEGVDVVLCAPKGSGMTVRTLFQQGKGINGSFAVHRDVSGLARDRVIATGMGIGCGHLFETTFEKEVSSDLTGERCVLMGMLQGAFLAQYEVLRENGHSPSEAYNETIEEALCSLYPLVAEKGMDWMYANCSTTAQRGALDWAPKFYKAIKPVVQDCYDNVRRGGEARRSIESNSAADYRKGLEGELSEIANQEMWKVGALLRPLRPENCKIDPSK